MHAAAWRRRPRAAQPRRCALSLRVLPVGRAGGSTIRNVVPFPTVLSNSTVPPWAFAISFTIASPRPVPGIACARAFDARKKRSNRRACSGSGTPIPVSATSSSTAPSRLPTRSVTCPPSGVNLTPFESRLSTACRIARWSTCTSGVSAASSASSTPRSSPTGWSASIAAAEIDVLERQLELAGVDPGDEEEVVGELQQALRTLGDEAEESLLLVCQRAGVAVEQQLEVAADRGQRRSHLVRDERDELVPHLVELTQALVLLREELGRPALRLEQLFALLLDLVPLRHVPEEAADRQRPVVDEAAALEALHTDTTPVSGDERRLDCPRRPGEHGLEPSAVRLPLVRSDDFQHGQAGDVLLLVAERRPPGRVHVLQAQVGLDELNQVARAVEKVHEPLAACPQRLL